MTWFSAKETLKEPLTDPLQDPLKEPLIGPFLKPTQSRKRTLEPDDAQHYLQGIFSHLLKESASWGLFL